MKFKNWKVGLWFMPEYNSDEQFKNAIRENILIEISLAKKKKIYSRLSDEINKQAKIDAIYLGNWWYNLLYTIENPVYP